MSKQPRGKAIVLFDGECSFCNSSVQFIIRRDPEGYYSFASLQGVKGKEMLEAYKLHGYADSIVLVEQGQPFLKSDAALRIAGNLRGFWRVGVFFLFIPRPIRDAVYNLIARNRYRWFGKTDSCMLPTPEIRERFWDG